MPAPPPASLRYRPRPWNGRRTVSRPAAAVAAAVILLLLACWAIAEPFWLRPLLQHHVRVHAGRQIDFDGARIRLDAGGRPVLRLRNLRIENAPWAAARPLVAASEVDITIAWRSFRGGDTVLPRVVVIDADIDLEQQPDGLRNWRLSDPQDRGPGKVRIQTLEAPRSRLRLLDRGRDLELELATTPLLAAEQLAGRSEPALTQSLQVRGSHRGTAFAGQFAVGPVFSLVGSGMSMPLRGRIGSRGASLALEGVARDLLTLGGFDLSAHGASPDLAASAGPLFATGALPALDADGRARLQKEGGHWAISALEARIGRSDVFGSFTVDPADATGRPLLRGALSTRHLDLDDLRHGFAGRSDAVIAASPARPDRSRPHRVDAVDAELDLTVTRVSGLAPDRRWATVDGLTAHASSQQGRLTVAPLAFNLAGGAASGRLTVDAGQPPNQVALELGVSGLRLDQLLSGTSSSAGIQGGLNLKLDLRAQGASLPALRDTASGHLSGHLVQATLPASLAARVALDGGQWLRALASPGKQVAVTCSVADLQIDSGRGRSTRLAIETEDVLVTGSARFDLQRKSYDLLLTPHRKQAALLALDKSVRLSGGTQPPKVGLVDRADAAGPADCRASTAR